MTAYYLHMVGLRAGSRWRDGCGSRSRAGIRSRAGRQYLHFPDLQAQHKKYPHMDSSGAPVRAARPPGLPFISSVSPAFLCLAQLLSRGLSVIGEATGGFVKNVV